MWHDRKAIQPFFFLKPFFGFVGRPIAISWLGKKMIKERESKKLAVRKVFFIFF